MIVFDIYATVLPAAGADIKEMQNMTFAKCFTGSFLSHWEKVAQSIKPVIAAVNGYAVGMGCAYCGGCSVFPILFGFACRIYKAEC